MTFESREEAGRRLGLHLREIGVKADVVVGLPRGGVVVAAEVARVLQRPLDVLVVRKIGHPAHREFAVGAMAEADVVLLDSASAGTNPWIQAALREVIGDEAARLNEYARKFHGGSHHRLGGERVLLVDDGLATGATMEAAAISARKQNAQAVLVAVPVASTNAVERLERSAEQVIALVADPNFDAVGSYYHFFSQTSDEEVVALLRNAEVPSP